MKARRLSDGLKVTSLLLVIVIFVTVFARPSHPTSVRGVYVHVLDDQTCETLLDHLAQIGLNTIFIDIYGVTDVGKGTYSNEKKGPWIGESDEPEFAEEFSLDRTLAVAKRFGISVHATMSCFGGPGIDPANESHRAHLREVVEYILRNFPTIDGIHLDYVRYVDERGWEANGDTTTITTFVKSIREVTSGKMLSAALLPCGNQQDYDATRNRTGQDFRELSQYLNFMCPMAYHLSHQKPPEWVGLVGRFMSSISQRSCGVFPTVQAYYSFTDDMRESDIAVENRSLPSLAFEVPSIGMLQFDVNWYNPESSFPLKIRDPYAKDTSSDEILRLERRLTGYSFLLRAYVAGAWTAYLGTNSSRLKDEALTVHISDLDEAFPGYGVLRDTISQAMIPSNGFCVFALNNLSAEESEAIRDAIETTQAMEQECDAKNVKRESLRLPLEGTGNVPLRVSGFRGGALKLACLENLVKRQTLLFGSP